jgi:hypothetical protein
VGAQQIDVGGGNGIGVRLACALNNNNVIRCWGSDVAEVIDAIDDVPIADGNHSYQKVTVGRNHVCGLRTVEDPPGTPTGNASQAWCWGPGVPAGVPPAPNGQTEFGDLSAGHFVTCGLRLTPNNPGTHLSPYCWDGDGNQTGDGHVPADGAGGGTCPEIGPGPCNVNFLNPPANITNAKAISAGSQFACVIASTDGLICWGQETDGGDVNAPPPGSFVEVSVSGIKAPLFDIDLGYACARRTNGRVVCWGEALGGQFEDAATGAAFVSIDAGGGPADFAAGGNDGPGQTCGVLSTPGFVGSWMCTGADEPPFETAGSRTAIGDARGGFFAPPVFLTDTSTALGTLFGHPHPQLPAL